MYCGRAWWYHQQGVESENAGDLAAGEEIHTRHGRTLLVSGCLRLVAYASLMLAILLLTIEVVKTLAD